VEANNQFFKWIERNYQEIINGKMAAAPVLSHTLFKTAVAPKLGKGKPTYFIVIDNLRWDQWQAIRPAVLDILKLEKEDMYMGILPTATQYSRNAIFAGLTPLEIERRFKDKWVDDEDEGGKNLYEHEFLADQLQRLGPYHQAQLQ
jgi:hypothetical protein